MYLESLKKICKLKDIELLNYLKSFLSKRYKKVKATADYIMAEGDLPFCLIAHIDTVFMEPPLQIFHDREYNVMWSPDGLGADDRAGIAAILYIINQGFRPSVIFTTDEEMGGVGASILVSDHKKCPFRVKPKMLIELDRQGIDDCVFYNCNNVSFINYIRSYGFTYARGSFTDISIIAPAWNIAAVNLSIGYLDEHSFYEHLYLAPHIETIKKVINILNNSKDAPYFKYKV